MHSLHSGGGRQGLLTITARLDNMCGSSFREDSRDSEENVPAQQSSKKKDSWLSRPHAIAWRTAGHQEAAGQRQAAPGGIGRPSTEAVTATATSPEAVSGSAETGDSKAASSSERFCEPGVARQRRF
jgi:hypothetical protein